jgi:hypothetical protein
MEARPYLKKVSIVMAFYYEMEKVLPDKLWQNREHFYKLQCHQEVTSKDYKNQTFTSEYMQLQLNNWRLFFVDLASMYIPVGVVGHSNWWDH